MEETATKYTTEELINNVETTYTNILNQRQVELETLLTRLEETESTKTETEVTNN